MVTAMTAATPDKLRVTVLAGGPSAEREISLASGSAVANALMQRGHQVFVADIGPDMLDALDHEADVVFPALHGTFGEDGTIQRIMEERGICFVGSGSQASATAIDKVATKMAAAEVGVPTPDYEVVTPPARPRLSVPVVVKPIAQGSSVATTIVREASKLDEAVAAVAGVYGQALVEQFVPGDELTIGFLGNRTLPPIRIRPRRDFYDYEAKYKDDRTEYLFETGFSSALLERAAELSRRVFEAIGCRHLARIDWMVGPDERPWFLEVNTIPGFTSHSLVPKAAARIGIPFDELVERLVRMAMEDHS
jgi:D-alanine-D-alanine ligase